MAKEFKATSTFGGLSGGNARRFRLHMLNVCAAGYAAAYAAWEVARYADVCDAGYTAWTVAVDAAWDVAGKVAWDATLDVAGNAAKDIAKKVGTPQKISYAICRSVILDRKKIFSSVDASGTKISSAPMTVDKVVKCCTTMMTFNEEQFARLQLTIPLKMLDYLLGYERAIFFLRHDAVGHYYSLMDKHLQLVRRLGLEKHYAELTVPRHGVIVVSECLPTLPVVLIDIIIGYGYLHHDNADDLDEIYNRLLLLKA